MKRQNIDEQTVDGFGDEWERFDQSELDPEEAQRLFDLYFAVFPWQELPEDAEGFDLGCGSGRWAKWVAPRVGRLHCIDPSSALEVAKRNLAEHLNCEFHSASVDAVYVSYENGQGKSKLSVDQLERAAGCTLTGRNVRTVHALIDL